MGKPTFSNEQFLAAIPGSGGLFTAIAKRVGCQWHTAKKRVLASPSLVQAWQDECETILDMAEGQLYGLVKGGDIGAIKFILATKGKHRGYVERQEVTGADGGAVRLAIVEELVDANGGG